MDFGSQEAMEAYLKDHPDADKGNHRVIEKKVAPKAGECPKHLKKTFEKGTVPLRERACYGDDVAFMDGKTYHIGTLSEFDTDSGLMEVTLRDGKKLSVPRKDLRMPKGGKRVRDSYNRRQTMDRQAMAGELVKLAKELIGCETCGCRDREAAADLEVGDYVMQAGHLDTLYGKVLDFADRSHREPIVIGIIAYGVGTPEMRISEGPTRIVCRGPDFRNVYGIASSEVPVKLRTLIDSRWDRSI